MAIEVKGAVVEGVVVEGVVVEVAEPEGMVIDAARMR
jgi:hypothetical protein